MPISRIRRHFRYRFDNFMARGGGSIFICLTVVFTALLMLLASLRGLVNVFQPDLVERSGGFWRQLYLVFIQLTDPGNMAYDIDSSGWFKLVAVLCGLVGVVILSSLIAFITTALNTRLERLKRGHSHVIEENHTLILGWNDRTIEVIRELIIANESENNPVIVVLAQLEKQVMDDYLQLRLPDTRNTRVVTRSGNTTLTDNLEVVSLATCKSVIVLARVGDVAIPAEKSASDAIVIKTCLAVETGKPAGKKLNVVAELFEENSRQVVRDIAPGEFLAVNDHEILAKLIVQTSRSTGLSVVYMELLSFDGCEMYFHEAGFVGKSFGAVQFHFSDSVPIGIRSIEGVLVLNPPVDRVLVPGDSLLIIAKDDSTIEYLPKPVMVPIAMTLGKGWLQRHVETMMILGWNPRATIIIREFGDYVLEGSRVDLVVPDPDRDLKQTLEALQQEMPGLEINLIEKNPLSPEDLLSLAPFGYENILLLSQGGSMSDSETTDSETIVILLQLRRIFADHLGEAASTRVITEIQHSDNQALIARAGVNDFIISTRLVSMMLAQISEEAGMRDVYEEIFKEEGSEIYVKPVSYYLETLPARLRFGDLMALAQHRGEVCIGWKRKILEGSLEHNFGVELIPPKDKVCELGPEDALIVMAEDET